MKHRVLIVDDEKNIRRTLRMVLTSAGYECFDVDSGEAALAHVRDEPADVVLLDIGLPGQDGIETLSMLKSDLPTLPVIMISGRATVAAAVESTQKGAFDFLEKPLSRDRVLLAVRNALRVSELDTTVDQYRAQEARDRALIGESDALQDVRDRAARVAPMSATVLITGESGTGKELLARFVHDSSPRKDQAFIKVNCAAIPEELIETELFGCVRGAYTGADRARDGKFQAADGGTLFLDEVGDMSPKVQAKVLRAIQEKEIERVGESTTRQVDVRIIAATNKDLEAEAQSGGFREDLFYRLNVVPLRIPPLRERKSDIARLARHFALRYAKENALPEPDFTTSALAALVESDWPGNVRELRNAIERLVILGAGPTLTIDDVQNIVGSGAATTGAEPRVEREESEVRKDAASGLPLPTIEVVETLGGLSAARDEFERICIELALDATGGNVSQSARRLGVERSNLHKKMAKHGLEARPPRSANGG